MERKYSKVRLMCEGKIKVCDSCRNIPFTNGFCTVCRRPLDLKEGDNCNTILGYKDGDLKKTGKIDIVCRVCNSITTF